MVRLRDLRPGDGCSIPGKGKDFSCLIIGFRRGGHKFFRFLGYYVACVCLISTLRDCISCPSRVMLSKKNKSTFENGTLGSPETPVSIHFTPRNNPEDGRIEDIVL